MPSTGSDKVHVDLTGPPQTMLDMVYARLLDADSPQPVLGDPWAKTVMDQVDYDVSKSPIAKQRRRQTMGIAVRGAQLDIWTRQFLASHHRPVVLQIGAGLDSRVFRVDPGREVDWYDIDFANVIALRERFYPKRDNYHLVASSATDLSWLEAIPADRPALFLAEGVSMYLTESEGVGLLRRVVERFPAGELQLDFWSRFGSKAMRKSNAVVRWSNSEVSWSVDEPDDILSAVPGTRLIRAIPIFEAETTQRLSKGYRRFAAAAARTPVLRKIVQLHRYAF